MTDLKPCPFCGLVPPDTNFSPKGFTYCTCMNSRYFSYEQWNSRPIEDRLRAALENLVNAVVEATVDAEPVYRAAASCGVTYSGRNIIAEMTAAAEAVNCALPTPLFGSGEKRTDAIKPRRP